MTQRLIPWFCLFHMSAILWWALPRNFESLEYEKDYDPTPVFAWEQPILKAGKLAPDNPLRYLFNHYIDLTGSQQYWDFFAPTAPKFHQYLSICDDVISNPAQGKINCKSQPLFSNLTLEYKGFNFFGNNDSRIYRLTENLIALADPKLLQAFTNFHQGKNLINKYSAPLLVLHQFELAPGFAGLPSYGYQMDKLLISGTD